MSCFLRSVLTIGALFALIGTGPAQAELSACNRTDQTISVAIGYSDNGTWTSEGWWTMRAGDCKVMVPGDLKHRYYYWRATQDGLPLPAEEYYFCTSSKVFTIAGDTQCEERGYDRVAFSQVDTGDAKSYTIAVSGSVSDVGGSAVAPADDLGNIRALLQGTWRAPLDEKLQAVIEGDQWTFTYDGDEKDSSRFDVALTCPVSEGDGPVLLFTHSFTKGDPECWLLVNADRDSFEIYVYETGEEALLQRQK